MFCEILTHYEKKAVSANPYIKLVKLMKHLVNLFKAGNEKKSYFNSTMDV